jgi:hypothetical protein
MFAVLGIGTQEIVLLGFLSVVMILPAWLACRIATRAGFNTALGLITLIPFGILIYLAILAFADWPAIKRRPTDLESDYDDGRGSP